MTNLQWQNLQSFIHHRLSSNDELPSLEITEDHKGAFLAFFDHSNHEMIVQEKHLNPGLTDVSQTMSMICEELLKKEDIPIDDLKKSRIELCLVKDAIYLKNPMEWDQEKDGVCFQWGNRYRGYYMPYEIVRMGDNKITILDKLCSYRCSVPSSLWRVPCGLIFKLAVNWYK